MRQAFPAWAHPDVPEDAEIVHAVGSLTVPAAGATDYLLGVTPLGGTGILFRPRVKDPGRTVYARLLAYGVAVRNFREIFAFRSAMGAGAETALATLFGAPSGRKIEELLIRTWGVGGALRYNGVTIQNTSTGVYDVWHALRFDPLLTLLNLGALSDFSGWAFCEDPDVAQQIAVRPVLRQVDPVTGDAITSALRMPPMGTYGAAYPQARADGSEPDLVPVAAPGMLAQGDGYGFGVQVLHVPAGTCPLHAVVYARLVLAVWDGE